MKYYLCKMVFRAKPASEQSCVIVLNTDLAVVAHPPTALLPPALVGASAGGSGVQGHPKLHGKFEAKENLPQQQLLNKYYSSC